jgi:hypothetical protein
MEDVEDMKKAPEKLGEFDKHTVSIQTGIEKVHSILARVNQDKWDATIVALVKGMDTNYFNDDAIGLSRFKLNLMTEAHTNSMLTFLQGITGLA